MQETNMLLTRFKLERLGETRRGTHLGGTSGTAPVAAEDSACPDAVLVSAKNGACSDSTSVRALASD